MPRPPSVPGGRTRTIKLRLSEAELTVLDRRRGKRTRSDYLRAPLTAPVHGFKAAVVHPVTEPQQTHPPHTAKRDQHVAPHTCTWGPKNKDGWCICSTCYERKRC